MAQSTKGVFSDFYRKEHGAAPFDMYAGTTLFELEP